MSEQEHDSHQAVVVIDPELWSTFAWWVEGRGFKLTEITGGEGAAFYRLHEEDRPVPARPVHPHVPSPWA